MGMGLGYANQTGESSLGQFAVAHFIPDVGQQLQARVLEGQICLSSYFNLL
jgi:hypothetical protein